VPSTESEKPKFEPHLGKVRDCRDCTPILPYGNNCGEGEEVHGSPRKAPRPAEERRALGYIRIGLARNYSAGCTGKFDKKAKADPSPPFAHNATGFGMTTGRCYGLIGSLGMTAVDVG
jgi:hypothetical protein